MLARLLITHRLLFRATVGWLAASLVVLLGSATALAAPDPTPTARPIMGPKATLVAFSDQDPWTLQLSGFDLGRVESVTYYVRDAAKRWHTVGPVTAAPFTADVAWWAWNDAGQIAVTSHVQMQGGGKKGLVKDPGGWTSIDGRNLGPGGRLEALANSDGSLGARYAPDRDGPGITGVEFWLRLHGQWNRLAEVSQPSANGWFEAPTIGGTDTMGWRSDDTAMSVHVVWPGGRQLVDPAPWAWRDHFVTVPAPPTPTPEPTPTTTPTPEPTPTPTPTATAAPAAPPPPTAAPPPAAEAPAPAPPAPAPPTAAPAGCYPLTNAGNCYQPGEFCRTSDHGRTGRAGNGEAIVCEYNNGWRWEPA